MRYPRPPRAPRPPAYGSAPRRDIIADADADADRLGRVEVAVLDA